MSEKAKAKPGEVKPGKSTTEFLLAVAGTIVSALLAAGVFTPAECGWEWCSTALQVAGIAGAVLTALGYGKIRKDTKGDAQKASAMAASGK